MGLELEKVLIEVSVCLKGSINFGQGLNLIYQL